MTLADYKQLVAGNDCFCCGKPLDGNVEQYPHANGWPVEGFDELQWLFITCRNRRCKYQNSFATLKIKRAE